MNKTLFRKKTPSTPRLEEKPQGRWSKLFHEYKLLLLCAIIPAFIMLLIYIAKEHYPFGDGSVLVLDLNAQYVWFFEALRNFAKGDASLLYSFSRSLGGEFMGMYAYYLASPLSYLVCLFPQSRMLEALLTLFLVKVGICGFTFGFYIKKTSRVKKPFSILIFSTLYALMSYAVVQQHNTMWIDALMWLPLITLGIESLIKYGKFKMYTIFLALAVFSNYYIGYMICIYCLIYFFLYYFAHNENNRNNPYREKLHFIKSLGRIALFSVIALGMAAIIILSAYYSLNFGKTTFSDPAWKTELKYDIMDMLYKFLPGSYDTVRPEGMPFVYCGVLTLLLIPSYFLSNKYSIRQKIFSGIFIFIFIASFTLNIADLIWHGFQYPNWLNHRYSFLLSFYLCVLACRAFDEFESISLRTVAGTGGLIALFCILLQKYDENSKIDPNDYTTVWFTLIMIFAYLALLALLRKSTDKQIVSIFLVAVVSVEVFLNGLWSFNAMDEDVVFSKYSKYNDFLNKSRPIVEQVQEADTSFYRMEKTFARRTNDNMALKIRGLSGSTSTLNEETIRFLNKMGYSSKSHWSKYIGGNPVSDSLLGLKYILANTGDVQSNYYEAFLTDSENGYTAYKNPYALSIAYGVNPDVLDFPLGFKETLPETKEEEPVKEEDKENAAAIGNAVQSLKSKLNKLLDIDETQRKGEYVDIYSTPFERLNAIVGSMVGVDEGVPVFVPVKIQSTVPTNTVPGYVAGHNRYNKDDQNKPAYVSYTITMDRTGELYFYLPTDYPREIKLTLHKGEDTISMGTFNGNESACIISLGMQEEGTELTLDMEITTAYFYVKPNQDVFYCIDWETFDGVMEFLAKDQLQITEYTETSFLGTFTPSVATELVMTTLPYDKGWKVYVNGEEVETQKALGSLVSFYVDGTPGKACEIEMIYRPNTYVIGVTVTLISIGLLILLIVLEKKMKQIRVLRSVISIPIPPDFKLEEFEAEIEDATLNDATAEETASLEPPAEEKAPPKPQQSNTPKSNNKKKKK